MRVILWLVLFAGVTPAFEQTSAPAAVPPAAGSAAAAPVVAPPPAVDTFVYQADGRRDPFLSLTANVAESRAPLTRAEGIAGLSVTELSVRGVMKSRGSLIAMVQGPDRRAYVVHQGDKFADGTIKAVTAEGLVIVQQVNDPLSLVKQREVRKLLRSVEDGKQ
ncbi:MAG: pilus assembly protein PilP [Vicinamibacterales bacterium]